VLQSSAAPLLAIPPALRRWWRGQPRLALEDSPAPQLIALTAMAPVERLLVLGPDAPPLAALIADTAGLEPTPHAVLCDARAPADANDRHVRALRFIVGPPLCCCSDDVAVKAAAQPAVRGNGD